MGQSSKNGFFRALPAALLVAGVCALPAAHAAPDGTITVNGEITGSTCTISGNGGGENFTVALPEVLTSALGTAGARSGEASFNISLTNCQPNSGKVWTYFEPGATVADTGRLKNSGTAANVEVGLYNKDGTPIQIGAASASQNSKPADIVSGTAKLEYTAQYVATAGGAGSGSVNTSVLYSLEYQ
ncbi:fimbrial protein [Pseudoxanthomonas beigongshangi]